ncbi:conserved hypothetical protein [Synechococcus sp. CC9902]|uniref:hypothetical protein n=1 Tax=Synechococcus sp. (strain CC9902) TaxID=316279 RepID=UPI00005D3D03|nr:hypothetical protein [Synechococcus sp. CC9902]ABB25081.1 conserved hypothetical protein [Synechococcus sp. CC9902]
MNILIAIVHYWNPDGGGRHQSLRSDPQPRIDALQHQLMNILRIGSNQSVLHLADRAVYRANDSYRNNVDIKIITDGTHHVLDYLDPSFMHAFEEIPTTPSNPKFLGFEVHKVLADHLNSNYDLYCYLEDDLLIHDPTFFSKIAWFSGFMGYHSILLPQRFEFSPLPHAVDRFYIDGPLPEDELRKLVSSSPVRLVQSLGFNIPFAPPDNPHAGCFFLSHQQLSYWVSQDYWLDHDVSFISPLESAATLGIAKCFSIFKPCFSHASWLEIQHHGTVFHELIGDSFA